ncbi:type II secretion system F family protein [Thermofilum pendens]|uniref:Type II secretion system protein n=1 Tax=Thermofilum pendens (strain DSM 2475 / Hrk 5) TaxID=368408 RepID=A1RYC6_THEPD|nr:type II secretion system F family protein [Thermofilum pendens]ABL78206.1 type II secretion system protein [Thermofilum pendens Hrk 5]
MPYIEMTPQRRLMLLAVGAMLGAVPLFLVASLFRGELLSSIQNAGGVYLVTSLRVNVLVTFSLVLFTLPYAFVDYLNRSFTRSVESVLPELFKGLAEAVRSGLTLPEALSSVAETLGGEVGKMLRQVVLLTEMGVTFQEAIARAFSRYRLPSLDRLGSILLTAYESGGKVIDALETSAQIFGAIRSYEEERATTINPHVLTIYAATILYVILSLTILYVFVMPLSRLQGIPGALGKINPGVYAAVMYYSGVMIAFFGGLIAGKMRHGKASAGLIHADIQVAIVAFSFLLAEKAMA